MAHMMMRVAQRGCHFFEREYALASSRCLAHSLAEAQDSPGFSFSSQRVQITLCLES